MAHFPDGWSAGLVGVLAALSTPIATAQPAERAHARATLIAEHTSARPGDTVHLGVAFDIDPDWHIYWRGSSDTGMPTRLRIDAPEGWSVGPIQWPAPRRYSPAEGILDHIHERELTLIIPVTAPETAVPGAAAAFRVHADWLVCQEACIPGEADLTISIPVAANEPQRTPQAAFFDRARATVPVPVPEGRPAADPVRVTLVEGVLDVQVAGAKELEFYPGAETTPLNALGEAAVRGDRLRVTLKPGKDGGVIAEGVIRAVGSDGKPTYYDVRAAVPAASTTPSRTAEDRAGPASEGPRREAGR